MLKYLTSLAHSFLGRAKSIGKPSCADNFTLPSTMKANIVLEYGSDFDKIYKYEKEFPLPIKNLSELGANQVLVKIHAAGVNPLDFKITSGGMRPMMSLNFPASTYL